MKKNKEKYFEIFYKALDAIFLADPTTKKITDCNKSAALLTGFSRKQILSMKVYNLHPKDRIKETIRFFKRQSEGKEDKAIESEVLTKNGKRIQVSITANPVYINNKKYVEGIFRDISKQKKIEKELVKSYESIKELKDNLDNLIEGCQVIGFDWRFIYLNDSAVRQGRKSRKEFIGSRITDVLPGIEKTPMFAMLKRVMEKRKAESLENEFTYSDGSKGWFDLSVQPIKQGIFILSIDITEKKNIEENLKFSEEKFSKVFNATPNSISISRLSDGKFIDANYSAEKIFGYSRREVIGKTSKQIQIWADYRDRDKMIYLLKKNEVVKYLEVNLRRKSGQIFPALISVNKIFINGELCLLIIAQDITEIKKVEEKLKQNEEKYRNFIENHKGIAYKAYVDGTPVLFDGNVNQITGYKKEDFIYNKINWQKLIIKEDAFKISDSWKKLATKPNTSLEREYRIRNRKGDIVWIQDLIK